MTRLSATLLGLVCGGVGALTMAACGSDSESSSDTYNYPVTTVKPGHANLQEIPLPDGITELRGHNAASCWGGAMLIWREETTAGWVVASVIPDARLCA